MESKILFGRYLVPQNEISNYTNKAPFVVVDMFSGAMVKVAFEGDNDNSIIYGMNAKTSARVIDNVSMFGIAYDNVEILTGVDFVEFWKDNAQGSTKVIDHVISSGAKHPTETKTYKDGHKELRPLTLAEQVERGCARHVMVEVTYKGDLSNKAQKYTQASAYSCIVKSDTCNAFVKSGYLKDLAK